MLWTPPAGDFGFSVDNYGSTYSDAGIGTNSPGHANANTKGANTAMLSAIAQDCYGISIMFSGQSATTSSRRCLVDLLVDPAGGTSWSVAIANLAAVGPTFGTSGAWGVHYYFPLYLKSGTAIGTAHQNAVAGTLPLRVAMRVYGKPKRPHLVKCISKVQTLNADTTTTGTTVATTPGTAAKGSYSATLGTLLRDSWWWQAGVLSTDGSMTANGYLWDVAVNATNKLMCLENMMYSVTGTIEQSSKSAMGTNLPIREAVSGENVYTRAAAVGAPDTGMGAVVYAGSC